MKKRYAGVSGVICALLQMAAAWADGPGAYRRPRGASSAPPTVQAQEAYNAGVASVEQAAREEKLIEANRDARAVTKAQTGAAKAYERALSQFAAALRIDPSMYEAHTYVGYANRKLGRYERALDAYAAALRLKPDFGPAVEYQGEAFLGLNRIEDAKRNYLRLYGFAPALADKLLTAMQQWIERRKRDPQGVDPAAIAALSHWMDERMSHTPKQTDSGHTATAW